MPVSLNKDSSDPISIGFDAKRAFYNKSGLGNYSRNLIFSLNKYYPGNTYYLFTPKTKNRLILENEGQFKLVEPNLTVFKLLSQPWRLKYMTRDIKRQKLNIYHGLSHELPLGIEDAGIKSVVTVHDLIFIRFPEFYNWFDAKIYYKKLDHACRISDKIVAISEQTKKDLISFLNIPHDKITVIHQGCNPHFRNNYSNEFQKEVRTKYNLPEKYLLYVGTIEERKNLLNIVKAIHISNIKIPLIVVGRKMKPYYEKVQSYIRDHKLFNIFFPENVLNSELPVIYRNAHCFIYPSIFEGFGIPVLEALVSGTPVITSRGGCFNEAGGPGSLYIDPGKPEEIGDALSKIINSEDLRQRMITMGTDYAGQFSDEIITNAYMKLYNSLLR